MLDLNKSAALSEAFEPGVGNNPERDNFAGAMVDELKYAINQCLKAFCFDDTIYLDKGVFGAIINTSAWLEDCIEELAAASGKEVRHA